MKTRGHPSRIRTSATRTRNDVEGATLLQVQRSLRDACVASQHRSASPSEDCSSRGPWTGFHECRSTNNRFCTYMEYAARIADTASRRSESRFPKGIHDYPRGSAATYNSSSSQPFEHYQLVRTGQMLTHVPVFMCPLQ